VYSIRREIKYNPLKEGCRKAGEWRSSSCPETREAKWSVKTAAGPTLWNSQWGTELTSSAEVRAEHFLLPQLALSQDILHQDSAEDGYDDFTLFVTG